MVIAMTGDDELEKYIVSIERDGCNKEMLHFEWLEVPEPSLSDRESKILSLSGVMKSTYKLKNQEMDTISKLESKVCTHMLKQGYIIISKHKMSGRQPPTF